MANKINNLIEFVSFTHDIRKIKRAMWVLHEEQFENDSEHGYQLALVALYIIEENKLSLDPFRSMGLAIVHDVLEVHAGDTPVYGSQGDLASRDEREKAALARLKEDWPKMQLMHQLIDEYETKSSPEAKFVYALDKLVPMVNNYLDKGRSWKRQNVRLEHVVSVKAGKIDIDPTINKYYRDILKLLKEKPELFS
jgi:putative hydrolase of HD superfamily